MSIYSIRRKYQKMLTKAASGPLGSQMIPDERKEEDTQSDSRRTVRMRPSDPGYHDFNLVQPSGESVEGAHAHHFSVRNEGVYTGGGDSGATAARMMAENLRRGREINAQPQLDGSYQDDDVAPEYAGRAVEEEAPQGWRAGLRAKANEVDRRRLLREAAGGKMLTKSRGGQDAGLPPDSQKIAFTNEHNAPGMQIRVRKDPEGEEMYNFSRVSYDSDHPTKWREHPIETHGPFSNDDEALEHARTMRNFTHNNNRYAGEPQMMKFLGIRRKYQKMLMRTKANYNKRQGNRDYIDPETGEYVMDLTSNDVQNEVIDPNEWDLLDHDWDTEDQNDFSPKVKTHKGKHPDAMPEVARELLRQTGYPTHQINHYVDSPYGIFRDPQRTQTDMTDQDIITDFQGFREVAGY